MSLPSGLWIQYYTGFEALVYDTILGKNSFSYGFPLIAAGSCGFLRARRSLLEHTNTPKHTSYVLDSKLGILLFAEGSLHYFLFLPDAKVAYYKYAPQKIALFGRLGALLDALVPCDLKSTGRENLERSLMLQLMPTFQKMDKNFPSSCSHKPVHQALLSATFFKELSYGTGVDAALYLVEGEDTSRPAYLMKGAWMFQGNLHVWAPQ